MTSVPRFVKAGAQCVFGNWNINDEQNHGTGSAAGAEAGMSNLEYVQELCGTDAVGWICEQLASELDSRDKRIEELEIQLMACSDGAAMEAMNKDKRIKELDRQYEKLLTKYEHTFDQAADLEAKVKELEAEVAEYKELWLQASHDADHGGE